MISIIIWSVCPLDVWTEHFHQREILRLYGKSKSIADGVYETRLDGYELNDAEEQTGRKTTHILFVDSYSTWWEQGKSYFCRLIDMLNEGSVDEIIFGYEVLTRWPEVLREIIES